MSDAANKLSPLADIAVCYARQSKTVQADELAGESLSSYNQIEKAAAYCALYNLSLNRPLSEASVDLDTSGGAKQQHRKKGLRSWQLRPGLMNLYEAAKRAEFKHLIVYDLNRLGGDATELHLIREAFDDLGVTIHVIKESIRTDTEGGRLVFSVFTAFSEKRLKDISSTIRDNSLSRIKRAREAAAIGTGKGKHHGNPPSWIRIKTSHAQTPEQVAVEVQARGEKGTIGWYELNEYAQVVSEAIELRLTGLSYTEIAQCLNTADQPGGPRYRPQGGTWNAHALAHLFNPQNIHRFVGSSIFHPHGPSSEPLITHHVFPPLITEEEYARLLSLQSSLISPNLKDTRPLKLKTPGLLSGLLYCAICGARCWSNTYAETPHGRYRYYYCPRANTGVIPHPHRRADGEAPCRRMRIPPQALEQAVLYAVVDITWAMLGGEIPLRPTAPPRRRPTGGRTLADVQKAMDIQLQLVETQVITIEEFTPRWEALKKERASIEAVMKQDAPPEDGGAALQSLADTLKAHQTPANHNDWRDEWPPQRDLRLLLCQLVERIECPIIVPGERTSRFASRDAWQVRVYLKPTRYAVDYLQTKLYDERYQGERPTTIRYTEEPTGL